MSLEIASAELAETGAPVKPCCKARAAAAAAQEAAAAPAQAAPAVSLGRYKPIFIMAGAAAAGGLMLAAGSHGAMFAERAMGGFMGLFLLPLALLKLFDIEGFAASFARYDVVAKVWPAYGRLYPFAELALALLFLSGLYPLAANAAAIVIGTVGTIGILRSLSRGEQLRCACVGSVIDVPLGSVSIVENAGMAMMATAMLLM